MYTNQMQDYGFSDIVLYNNHLAKDYKRKQCDLDTKWISEPPTKDGEYLVLYIEESFCNPIMITEDDKYKMTICNFKDGVWELKANIIAWKENNDGNNT